jgi:precorrin-6Y C5,15-methyltransferase (decarboxylating)
MSKPWLSVIGIGEDGMDGLNAVSRRALDQAQVLVGGERHLAMIPSDARERLAWPSPFSAMADTLLALKPKPVAVLATGDPMWFGVGETLATRIPAVEMAIHPSPSAFSLAAARLGWSLASCKTLSVHGRALAAIQPSIQPGARLIMLTHDGETPAQVAAMLCERGYGPSAMIALEHMGGSNERRIEGTAAAWGSKNVTAFHTLAVECIAEPGAAHLPGTPGLSDDAYQHDGQLTKHEIRAITLAALGPTPGALLWDVGAGSGSIGIEWMRAAPRARAFAIERDPSRISRIAANAETLGTRGLQIVEGAAPDALAGLPEPDAVFIGGGLSAEALTPCFDALKPGGRLVANAVTIEGEAALFAAHATYGGALSRIAISRAGPVGPFHGWRPLMPVTQWKLRK